MCVSKYMRMGVYIYTIYLYTQKYNHLLPGSVQVYIALKLLKIQNITSKEIKAIQKYNDYMDRRTLHWSEILCYFILPLLPLPFPCFIISFFKLIIGII